MANKVPPSLEPSPQLLTDRCASFDRADFNSKGRRERENVNNNETLENSCLKTSAHHRHPSLGWDSHCLALYPINLNSNIDQLHSSQLETNKASIKISILSDPSVNKDSSFLSAALSQNEDDVAEPPEELSLEPHETLLQDAQEEALSASFSADSRSTHEEQDFILWGNAVFCLSEGRDSSGSSVQRHKASVLEESKKFHTQTCEQKQNIKHLQVPSKHGGVLSLDQVTKPENYHVAPVVSSVTCNTHQAFLAEGEENARHQSTFRLTFFVPDPASRQIQQAQAWEESSKERSLVSYDAQSCCLDFDAQELEASSASDCADGEVKGSETASEQGKDQQIVTLPVVVTDEGTASSTFPDMDFHKGKNLAAHEEVKIWAELELEIERDLEKEIKTKIYLLSQRLEELHVLQATRHPKQEQSAIEKHDSAAEDETSKAPKAKLAKTQTDNASKTQLSVEQGKTSLLQVEKNMDHQSSAHSKKQLSTSEKEVHFSYISTPVTNWKRFAMASGWVPHTKESKSQPPSSDVGLKPIKTLKHYTEGPATPLKSKVKVDGTSSFKPDYQTWTTPAASSKNFDWIRTLRSKVPSTPRVSTMKLGSGSPKGKSATASFKETFGGSVTRNLFGEDALSIPAKAMPKLQRKESGAVLSIGNKNPTPGTGSTTLAIFRSASIKRVSERPAVQAGRHARLTQKNPEEPTRQARTTTRTTKPTSVPRASPPQASSGKVSKIDRTNGVRAPSPSKQASTSVSAAHTEKVKRSARAVPSSSRSVTSKGVTTAAPSKASTKQASCLPQLSKSRVTTLSDIVSSTNQVQKGKLLTSGTLGRRQDGTDSKAPGASTRGKVRSKH